MAECVLRGSDTLLLPLSGSMHAIGKSPGVFEDVSVMIWGDPELLGYCSNADSFYFPGLLRTNHYTSAAEGSTMNERGKNLCPHEAYILRGETEPIR